jgi:peptidoglycan/xylan/chitin deacetylase (PgdA/CDA1 family)
MLNFRNTNIFFSLLLALAVGYHLRYGMPWYVYLLLFIVYSGLLFYGSYFVFSNFYVNVTCSADTPAREIAISFDDGPALSYTPQVLALLREHQVKAAFFCIGNRIAGNEELLMQLHEEGHVIGNHSYSHHFWFDLFSAKKMSADLKLMDHAMEHITGLKPRLFRPPYGVTNPNLRRAIEKGNYVPVGWNVRSLDTVIKDERTLLEKVLRAIKPGAIVLFHDTSRTTLAILPAFIKQVTAEGYKIVRLDKLLKLEAYA